MTNYICSKYRRFLRALVIILVSTAVSATNSSPPNYPKGVQESLWKTFNLQKVQNRPVKEVVRHHEISSQSQHFLSTTESSESSSKLLSYTKLPTMTRLLAKTARSSDNIHGTPSNAASHTVGSTYDQKYHMPQSQQALQSTVFDHNNNYAHGLTNHLNYGYQPYESNSYGQHHGHMEDDEELVEIEDKVFSKTIVATKALKIGKFVFTFFMVLVVLILAGLAKLGVSLSPVVLPLALLPIGIIALLLFVPLFLVFVPVVATGLGGGKRRRRSVGNLVNEFDGIGLNIPSFDVHDILKKIRSPL